MINHKSVDETEQMLQHIRALADGIGPRGATTLGEKQAAEYCADQLAGWGYQPAVDTFRSAKSIFHPHLLAAGLMLFAFLIYPLLGRISAAVAALISLIALVSDLLELGFISNPFRWIVPKGDSQNVIATLSARGEHRQDLILVGHLDTQKTGKIFSSPRWVRFFQHFTTIAFVTFSAQTAFFIAGVLAQWDWLWFASIPSAISAILLFILFWEADHSPFTPGANDNASAVAIVLTLAEGLRQAPLEHTRVWFALTGCEEVQHYGMIDFLKRYRHAFHHPTALIFEMIGVAGPAWETKEGIIIPFRPDPALVKIVETIAAERPELGAYPSFIVGGNSEMADAVRAGIPAITFFGLTPEGIAPYWHQMEDTSDKMNPDILAKTLRLTAELISRLDQHASLT